MLAGGPSQGYCQELVKNPQDAVLLTGYQDEESPGRALLDLAHAEGPRELRIGQATVPVACSFGTYGLSAHADRMQMVSWIEATAPRTVLLVHGDETAKESLSRSLQCDDVICARDGMVIERRYPPRRSNERRPSAEVPTVETLDVVRARHLLGPPGGPALRAAAVAEAWFGYVVDRASADRFARVLESAGLVRRDDHQRDRLWVLGVHESSLFRDEAELEESLKQANPKGRLLEFCTRMRIEPPVTDVYPEGAFHVAHMSIHYNGQQLASGACHAASKKTAEQIAAQTLLAQLAARDQAEQVRSVSNDDSIRLQAGNPKGRLLEWCAQHKIPAPHFQQDASTAGYRVRGSLTLGTGTVVTSPWFDASKLKVSEQAASEWLLQTPSDSPADTTPSPTPVTAPAASITPPGTSGRNAAMAINELCQAGILQASSYDWLDQSGPSHQPVFTVVAWATTADGRTIRTESVQAPSKKTAQRLAADCLLDLLVAAGLSRR